MRHIGTHNWRQMHKGRCLDAQRETLRDRGGLRLVPDGRLDLDMLPGYVFPLEVLLRVLTQNLEHHVDGILEVFPRLFACAALGDGTSLRGASNLRGNNHSLALTPAPPDTAAPITTASATEGGNTCPPGTWTNQSVTLRLTADDGTCSSGTKASGVKEIRYSATGAQNITERTYDPQNPPVISADGTTEVSYFSTDNAGNAEQPNTLVVKLDTTAPSPGPAAEPPCQLRA
jgi:hypothetical protein